MSNKEILREIWKKERGVKQNLLTTSVVESLFSDLIMHLERTLNDDSNSIAEI